MALRLVRAKDSHLTPEVGLFVNEEARRAVIQAVRDELPAEQHVRLLDALTSFDRDPDLDEITMDL